tara:strand:- start:1108 stop:1452 length:345 start_codon:yes stop_codon:yes gene_type:complete
MAQLSTKIEKYLAQNGVNTVDFLADVLLQDDGSGPYIKAWNIDSVAQPNDSQLAAVDTAADLEERQNAVRATRRAAYADIGDQLDMQYKDNVNSTTTWKDHVAAVKSANPIPTE